MSSALLKACRENDELISDLARFSEQLLSEAAVRRKYRDLLGDEAWAMLGTDDLLVEMVEAEKLRRMRNGAYKRERAQELVTKVPDVLGRIVQDERASPRHRIDASKALDDLAEGGSRAVHDDSDRVVVTINLGGGDVLHFDAPVKPTPGDDAKLIEHEPGVRGLPGFVVD